MIQLRHLLAVAAGAAISVTLAACGNNATNDATAPPQSVATTAAPAGTAATPANATREVELVRSVRPAIDRLTEALRKNDLAGSRQAYEAYDAAWNGIEVYVNFRSRELYNALEQDLQAKIADGLRAPEPRLADLVPASEALARKYDEAIALVQKGPALSPLFDDLATLRIVRSDLRVTSASLTAGDLPKARTSFAAFQANYAKAQPLLKVRSAIVEAEASDALAKANAGFQQPGATSDSVKSLVAALTDRFNYGVNLLNAAARNADLGKATFTEADTAALAALNDLSLSLRRSMRAWEAGTYAEAAQLAATAGGAPFDAAKSPLAAKSADAALKAAVDGYANVAGAAGDATRVQAANKSALEAVTIAQQVLVGQFWTDPRLQAVLAALPQA